MRLRPAARTPLLAIAALLAAALAVTATGNARHSAPPGAEMVLARELLFQDRDDGAVVVIRAADRHTVRVFEGENGFLRGTLRGLARARHRASLGADAPFRLARWTDGRLTLDDSATGQHVELVAFGPDNWGVFARLLDEAQ